MLTASQKTSDASFPDSIRILPDVHHAAPLGAEGPAPSHLDIMTPRMCLPPFQVEGEWGVLSTFGEAPESAQMRAVARNASLENSPTSTHDPSTCGGLCYTHPRHPLLPRAIQQSGCAGGRSHHALKSPSKKFHQELLHSRDHDSLIQKVTQYVFTSSR